MIRNCYFKCKKCGDIQVKYVDDKYLNNILKTLVCPNCDNSEFEEVSSDETHSNVDVKTKLVDNRKINKEKYMSSDYKAIRENINRVYKERKGLLGPNRLKYI